MSPLADIQTLLERRSPVKDKEERSAIFVEVGSSFTAVLVHLPFPVELAPSYFPVGLAIPVVAVKLARSVALFDLATFAAVVELDYLHLFSKEY